jgi:hypothetical protein
MARKKATKAGRPPRRADERLSKNRTFRVWDKLDEQLRAAAEQSRRTVSAEIEYRLENSFQMDHLEAQMKALLGEGFKEALWVSLAELGLAEPSLSEEERIKRWAKRIANRLADIERDKPDELPSRPERKKA